MTEYIQNNTGKLKNDKQGTYLHRGIKIYVHDPIVMKKTMITDLRSFLKVSCHTKFRFAEREAQCILGECGPLNNITRANMFTSVGEENNSDEYKTSNRHNSKDKDVLEI